MYPVAVVLQYTIQNNTILYNTQKHKITHTHSKQYITQKLQTQNYKHNAHKKFQPNTKFQPNK